MIDADVGAQRIAADVMDDASDTSERSSAGSDVWGLILHSLQPVDVAATSAVSKRWRDRSSLNWVWRVQVERNFPNATLDNPPPVDWKRQFRTHQALATLHWFKPPRPPGAQVDVALTLTPQHRGSMYAAAKKTVGGALRSGLAGICGFCIIVISAVLVVSATGIWLSAEPPPLSPFVIVRSDARPFSDAATPAIVELRRLKHAGHLTSDVQGILLRVRHAASHFHVVGPINATSAASSHQQQRHCGAPMPTHLTAQQFRCRWATNGGPFSRRGLPAWSAHRAAATAATAAATDDDPCDRGFFVSNGTLYLLWRCLLWLYQLCLCLLWLCLLCLCLLCLCLLWLCAPGTRVGLGEAAPEFAITRGGDWVIGYFNSTQADVLQPLEPG